MDRLKQTMLTLTYVNLQDARREDRMVSLHDVLLMDPVDRYLLSWHQIDGRNYIHLYFSRQSNLGLEYINDNLSDTEFDDIRKLYYEAIRAH